jgi:GTPase SAR1 family protein
MTIWDMPGNRDLYDFQGSVWLQETDVAIVFYSIIDRESIFGIQYFFNLLLQISLNIPILVVANKIDLIDTPLGNEKLLAEGRKFAAEVQRVRGLTIEPLIEGSGTNSKFAFKIINRALKLFEEQRVSESKQVIDEEPITSRELVFDQKITRLKKDFDKINVGLLNQGIQFSQSDIFKIKDYIENDRVLRDTLDRLDGSTKFEVYVFISKDLRWMESKHNFTYIFLYTEIKKLIFDFVSTSKTEEWAKTVTEYFMKDSETLDRFRTLSEELQYTIMSNLVNNRILLSALGDQIYLKYREKIYSA